MSCGSRADQRSRVNLMRIKLQLLGCTVLYTAVLQQIYMHTTPCITVTQILCEFVPRLKYNILFYAY